MSLSFQPSIRVPVAGEVIHLRSMAGAVPRPAQVAIGAAGSCRVKSDGRKQLPLDENQDFPLFDPLTREQRIELSASWCTTWAEFPTQG